MAKRPEYTRFSVYSKLDPSSKEYDIPSYERDIRNIINNAVKSALPEGAFFQLGEKELSKSGRGRWDIYVHTEDKSVVSKSLGTIESELKYKQSGNEKYHITRAIPVDRSSAKALWREERGETETESARTNKWLFTKTIAILTAIGDITRRILSSVIDRATVTSQEMLTAHNLGMSYSSVRGYRQAEITHGLKSGTITGAVADIQNKFGNITSLDEKALEALAVVMGGKIEEMATMGLGASAPEKVLASIVDTFNERANAGYNSVGQYVGEQQARRELYSYLLKVSPQVADIFATMQEEQHNINSLYKNQAETFESWKGAIPQKRGDGTWASYGEVKIMSEQWQRVSSLIDQIKEGITVALAPDIARLLQRIANSRIFMTESEQRTLNEKNKSLNQAELDAINKTLSGVNYDNLSAGEKAYYDVLSEQKRALEKELGKENVDDITTLPAEIQRRAEKLIRKQNKSVTQEGGLVQDISDVTYAEIADVVRIYGFDTAEAREAYRRLREREAKKADKDIEKENEAERKRVENQFDNLRDETSKSFWKTKDKQIKKARKTFSGNLKDLNALQALYQLREIYQFDFDLDKGEGTNAYERMYKALDRAVSAGLVSENLGGGYTVLSDKYINDNYMPIATGGNLVVDYGDPYLAWLYKQNKADMNEHILGYRADQIIEGMQTTNAVQAIDWLNDSVSAMKELAELSKKYPSSTYTFRGENIKENGGENIYRIVVDVKENGKIVESRNVLDTEGGVGFQGIFGYSRAGSNIIVTGKPASAE